MEIIDRVYEVAWAQIEARDLYRAPVNDGEREDALRRMVFASARTGPVDFDRLCDKVLANLAGQIPGAGQLKKEAAIEKAPNGQSRTVLPRA